MGRQVNQDLHALVPGQFFVEIAIRLFCFHGVGEALNRFFHAEMITRLDPVSEHFRTSLPA